MQLGEIDSIWLYVIIIAEIFLVILPLFFLGRRLKSIKITLVELQTKIAELLDKQQK